MPQNPKVVALRSTALFSDLGQNLGQDSDPTSEIAPDINKEMSYVPTLPLSAGIIQNFMVG